MRIIALISVFFLILAHEIAYFRTKSLLLTVNFTRMTFRQIRSWLLFIVTLSLFSPVRADLLDSAEYRKILQINEQVSKQYAPDKRTAVFEWLTPDDRTPFFRVTTSEVAAREELIRQLADHRIAQTKVRINLLPDSSVAGNPAGIVNLSVANLRSAPGHQTELATQALLGTKVDLLQQRDEYYRVRTPDGYISWVHFSSVTPMDDRTLQSWLEAPKVIFTSDYGHAYTTPDERSLRVSDLVMGNILVAEGNENGFVRVRYPDGRSGYVRSGSVAQFDHWLGGLTPSAASVIEIAKTMMGVPYLWGGTSVKGVDCSGFTKTAFFMNGFVIPRDASQQVLAGEPVDILTDGRLDTVKALKNLQPADLLFFASGSGRTPDARVTHVALYLGNGEFIHAAGTVRINSMLPSAPHYADFESRTLIAARRYLGQADPAVRPLSTDPYYTQTLKNIPR